MGRHTSGRAAVNGGVERVRGWRKMVGRQTHGRTPDRYALQRGEASKGRWGGGREGWSGGGWGTRWRGTHGAGLTGRAVHDYGAPEDLPRKVWGPSGGCVSAAHGAMAGRQVGLDEWRHGRRAAGHPETIDEANGRGTGSTEAVTRGGCGGRQSPPRGLSERREAG